MARSSTRGLQSGGDDLDRGNRDPRRLVAAHVHRPGRLQAEQARLVDLDPRQRNLVLKVGVVGEMPAERFAFEQARGHHFQRQFALPDGAHAMVDAARAEPRLGDGESVMEAAEEVGRGNADVAEDHLAMPLRPRGDS